MNNNDIDKIIEDSLNMSLNNYQLRDEVLTKVKDNLSNYEKRDQHKIVKLRLSRTNSFKPVVSLMCGLIVFCCLSLLFFPQARVFASNTINKIKTIFVIDDNGKIFEVGQDIALLNDGYNMPTDLSNSDIAKKVGFTIVIPSALPNGFNLLSKNIGLFLGKDISYETNNKISVVCQKAILDDTELEKLKEYNPLRFAGGIYSSSEGDIAICAFKAAERYDEVVEYVSKSKCKYEKFKMGDIEGVWLEQKRPVYPNGDMTQKPVEVINTYDMFLVSNDLLYFMSTSANMSTNRCSLSPEIGTKIAESFMAVQK